MAMVNVVYWLSTGWLMAQADWLGPEIGDHLALCLHSSHGPGELLQPSKHDGP